METFVAVIEATQKQLPILNLADKTFVHHSLPPRSKRLLMPAMCGPGRPQQLSRVVWHFIERGGTITVEVTGTRQYSPLEQGSL